MRYRHHRLYSDIANYRTHLCHFFVENPPNKRIPQQLWDMVDKLLLEKIPIAGISRVTEISEPWLQQYINQKYEHVPQQIDISKKGGT